MLTARRLLNLALIMFLLSLTPSTYGQEIPLETALDLYNRGRFCDAEVALTSAASREELRRHQDATELLMRIRLRVLDLDGVLSVGWGPLEVSPSSVAPVAPAFRSSGAALTMGQALLLAGRKDMAVRSLDAAIDMAEGGGDEEALAAALLIMGLATWTREPSASLPWESTLLLAERTFGSLGDELGAATAQLHRWRLRMKTAGFGARPDMAVESRDDLTTILELAERLGNGPLATGAALVLDDLALLDDLVAPNGLGPGDLEHLFRAWRVLETNPLPPREQAHMPEWLLPEPTELFRRLVARLMTRVERAGGAQGGLLPDDPAGRAAWTAFFFADRMHSWRVDQLRGDPAATPSTGSQPTLDPDSFQTRIDELSTDLSSRLAEMDAALLEYVLGQDATYAFVATEQGLAAEKLSIGRRELDSLIVETVGPWYRRGAAPVDLSSFPPDSTRRVQLYVSLFMALEGYFPQQGPLLVVPDGSLLFLPLEMLLRPASKPLTQAQREAARSHLLGDWEGERVLFERYDLGYVLSSEDLLSREPSDGRRGVSAETPSATALIWSHPRGDPRDLLKALPSWERLRDFFIPDPLFSPPEHQDVLLPALRRAAAALTSRAESQVEAREASVSLLEIREAPAIADVALPFFPREVEPWSSFLLVGTSADSESLSTLGVSLTQLRALPLSGTVLSLSRGCAVNPLRPYVDGDIGNLPWDDLSSRAGTSLLALRSAAADAGVRALGISLWPTGQTQVILQEHIYDRIASMPGEDRAETGKLIRAWNQGRRDLRFAVAGLDDPHHVVSLAHPFFWGGMVLSP